MICAFFELPYQRQVKKIYTVKFEHLLEQMEHLCKTNGGEFFFHSNRYYFYFSSTALAYEFSCVRFLFLVKNILEQNTSMLESYRIIMESMDDDARETEIESIFDEKRNLVLPENNFYITKKAYDDFSDYLQVENTDGSIFTVTDFSIFEHMEEDNDTEETHASIVLHKNNSFYRSMYNFILQNPIQDEDIKYLTKDEKLSFAEVQHSLRYLEKHRFEKDLPEYFVDAFFLYASLYFKIYKKKHKGNLPIIYSGDLRNETLNAEIDKILQIIPDAEVQELSKKLPSTLEINSNMLNLVFLITLFSDYLFIDELTEFFVSVNRSPDFFTDVCNWLYRRGIIFEKNNIYAHSTHLHDFIQSKIGSKAFELYDRLSAFLVEKYKAGEIAPSSEFVEIIKTLNYTKTDEIVLSVFLHTALSHEIIEANLDKKYGNAIFLRGLKYYQSALKLFENFSDTKALQEIKRAIEEFKYNRFLVGEYKSMVFWGNLSLRQAHLNDAVNYFSYALEIAAKLRDAEFLCEVLFNLCTVYFLKNDFTPALNTIKKLDSAIEKNFAQNWKVKSLFIKARVFIQLGEYSTAEKIFNSAIDFAQQYFPDFVPVCEIWHSLTLSFLGRSIEAQKTFDKYLEVNFDASLFFLESFFTNPVLKDECRRIFSEDVSELSVEKLLNISISRVEKSAKAVSGFSFAEDRMLTAVNELSTAEKMLQMFLLYYRGKLLMLDMFNPENKKLLSGILEQMTNLANEANNEKNIYAQWFFYFCYDISSKLNGESYSEAISYLSKSFKLLQGQVMLIDDNDARDKYMQKNFWNGKILTSAKSQQLL